MANAMDKHCLNEDERRLDSYLTGEAKAAISRFCAKIPDVPVDSRRDMLIGMGYQYESFDHMFAIIASNIQATVDHTDYATRYRTMQDVLQPFASEYAIEPERKLGRTHRELYAEFFNTAVGEEFPSIYPPAGANPWISCGRRWAGSMITHLECKDLSAVDRAKYNVGYHWAVEYLSVDEFDQLVAAWGGVGISAPYMQAHCDVEEEHSGCAVSAVKNFCRLDDPLVVEGIRDHELDLVGFYDECSNLIDIHVKAVA